MKGQGAPVEMLTTTFLVLGTVTFSNTNGVENSCNSFRPIIYVLLLFLNLQLYRDPLQ